jgi:hypothetical protein
VVGLLLRLLLASEVAINKIAKTIKINKNLFILDK